MRARARVSAEDFVVLVKTMAQTDLKGVVTVVAAVLEQKVAVHDAIESVVGEAMHAALLEEFKFQEDCSWKFFLQPQAPIQVPRRVERVSVHGERGRHGHGLTRWISIGIRRLVARIEKVIDSLPFEGLVKQTQVRRVVNNSNYCRQLSVAFVVEDVRSGQARREQRSADGLVPVQTQAGLNEQTIRNQPAVLGVGAGFKVRNCRVVAAGKDGITRTRVRRDRNAICTGCTGLWKLVGRRLVGLQERNRLPQELCIVIQTVQVRAEFNVVPSMPLLWRNVEIRQSLHSAGRSVLAFEIIARRQPGCQDVRTVPLRRERYVVLVHSEAGFEEGAAAEIILVFERTDKSSLRVGWSGRLRLEHGQSVVFVVIVVR